MGVGTQHPYPDMGGKKMRIQVLPLPMQSAGEFTEEPFALVVDQFPESEDSDVEQDNGVALTAFAEKCGARAVLITEQTVEVA